MPTTTIKSLEERLDEFEARIEQQLGSLVSKSDLADHQTQLSESLQAISDEREGLRHTFDALMADNAKAQAQLAVIGNGLATQQTQSAVLTARLDSLLEEFKRTGSALEKVLIRLNSPDDGLAAVVTNGRKLDELRGKFDVHQSAFTEFRAKVDTTLGFARWLGATAVVALISVIVTAFAVARSAGSVESTVQHHQKTLDEINHRLSERPKN